MGNRKSAGHLAGLCRICLYYLLENIALTYMMASNVGVIISVAPFFTATVILTMRRTFFYGILFMVLAGEYPGLLQCNRAVGLATRL